MILVGLVVFQAVLGMWTVTLLLKPLVVVLHLLGGMTILAMLWWVTLRETLPLANAAQLSGTRRWLLAALLIVVIQIFLGGWTSANYAALVWHAVLIVPISCAARAVDFRHCGGMSRGA